MDDVKPDSGLIIYQNRDATIKIDVRLEVTVFSIPVSTKLLPKNH